MKSIRNIFTLTLIVLLTLSGCSTSLPKTTKADVIIYGGTSAAVAAAVQLARMNKNVVIVCPDKHLGGLSSSGLGATDTGDETVVGGISCEFYQRVYDYYQDENAWNWEEKTDFGNKGQTESVTDNGKMMMSLFEPHVAEKVFEDFIRENKIKVFRDKWLERTNGVILNDGEIISIATLSGEIFKAKIFIDATYEGDLMAAAGVNYHVGREANSVYQEEWNGVQVGVLHHNHHFADRKISPYVIPGDSSSGLLPRISAENPGMKGEGDHRVQAYCFRMCLTQVGENRVPFEKPENYDSTQYELLIRLLQDGWNRTFNKFDKVPNGKTDVNNFGPFSYNNIGMNYDYPDASYERRAEIIREHETYQKGLLYFYISDPRIPEEIQTEMRKWGLAKDEFTDNGNWPHQIYVREARRMIGEFVMTENEVLGKKPVPKPIGMGSYTIDSHNVQRYITAEGYVQNEGDIAVRTTKPYPIALGSVMPKKDECKNLLVPAAVSSSHIAFGSIRMEPVFMILGQSAGVIASLSLDNKTDLHNMDYQDIKSKLLEYGQVLSKDIQ